MIDCLSLWLVICKCIGSRHWQLHSGHRLSFITLDNCKCALQWNERYDIFSNHASCDILVFNNLIRTRAGGYSRLTIDCGIEMDDSRWSRIILMISPLVPFAMSRSVSMLNVTITFILMHSSTIFGRPAHSLILFRAIRHAQYLSSTSAEQQTSNYPAVPISQTTERCNCRGPFFILSPFH